MCSFCLIVLRNHELRSGFGGRTEEQGWLVPRAKGGTSRLPGELEMEVRSSPLSTAPAQSSAFCREGEEEAALPPSSPPPGATVLPREGSDFEGEVG